MLTLSSIDTDFYLVEIILFDKNKTFPKAIQSAFSPNCSMETAVSLVIHWEYNWLINIFVRLTRRVCDVKQSVLTLQNKF